MLVFPTPDSCSFSYRIEGKVDIRLSNPPLLFIVLNDAQRSEDTYPVTQSHIF